MQIKRIRFVKKKYQICFYVDKKKRKKRFVKKKSDMFLNIS